MPRFAANLTTMYGELPFLERFGAAAADGFDAVEAQFPYDHPAAEMVARLAQHGLQQVLINAPAGDWAAGERGLACLPGREAECREGVERALLLAEALACPRVHLLAGVAPAGEPRSRLLDTYLANLEHGARLAAGAGRELLIEPINAREMPGYFLQRQAEAHEIVQRVGAPNLKVQMDLYHLQVSEGDVATKLRLYLPTGRVGHLQIAGVPERQEPDIGELNHAYLFDLIDELGWPGWVGCEYRPRRGGEPGGTSSGLGWRPRRSPAAERG
ncbi:2-oxo-tetronate isomerase [Ideonella sp. YS5]|uniref:2-oxo-tetronate isomerase n=1 Tax=Ideonella sp. YS5 TaxID=3453714 RepID=UPI003EED36C1